MEISLDNGNGSRSRRRRGGGGSLSEINVTPFVDVVLVLLIIFMLTAHVMEFGIQGDVPKGRAVRATPQELPVGSITKDGTTYLNERVTPLGEIPAAIQQRFGSTKA